MNPISPTIEPPRNKDGASEGFLDILRDWMGRALSALSHFSKQLCGLAGKTEKVAQNHLKHADIKTKSDLQIAAKKVEVKTAELLDSDLLLDEDADKTNSILNNLFATMGFDFSSDESVEKGLIFDTNGKIDKRPLTGKFAIEWNLPQEEGDELEILIFKGYIENGRYQGEGTFTLQDSEGNQNIILDGRFEKGIFCSGLLVLENCTIEGTFVNGDTKGFGTITYFSDKVLYRGNFRDAQPYGKGKSFAITKDAIIFSREGVFPTEQGFTGQWFDPNSKSLMDGEFKQNLFKGKITNFHARSTYEGEAKDNLYHGKGKLIDYQPYTYSQFTLEGTDAILEEGLKDEIKCTSVGEFVNGVFVQGEMKMEWRNGQTGIAQVKNGKIATSEVTKTDGFKYKGNFVFGTLEGTGFIYNKEGLEVYQGSIKCGYPHGKGIATDPTDGTVSEGTFEWGDFVGREDADV